MITLIIGDRAEKNTESLLDMAKRSDDRIVIYNPELQEVWAQHGFTRRVTQAKHLHTAHNKLVVYDNIRIEHLKDIISWGYVRGNFANLYASVCLPLPTSDILKDIMQDNRTTIIMNLRSKE